jgi:hypothetical protein
MSLTADFFRPRYCARKVALRMKNLGKIKKCSGNEFGFGVRPPKIPKKIEKLWV